MPRQAKVYDEVSSADAGIYKHDCIDLKTMKSFAMLSKLNRLLSCHTC